MNWLSSSWGSIASRMLLSVAVFSLAACGGGGKGATQVAAKVDKEEISVHQINLALQQQRLKPEQTAAVSKQVLERLIDQQVVLNRAAELKVDRDPKVMLQVDAARRDIIARAYAERISEAAAKPGADEVTRYYNEKPALFKERRLYNLQELVIEATPDQVPVLQRQLESAKTADDFIGYLRANAIRFSVSQAVRAAEQLPLAQLDRIAAMKDGESLLNAAPNEVQVVILTASRSQPVDEQQARPAIEQFLFNENKRKILEDDTKRLRAAAKIEYVGSFAEAGGAAGAASSPLTAASANQGTGPRP